MKTLKLSSLALAVFASACGAVSNGEPNTNASPTPTPGGSVTIVDIQKGNVDEDTSVTLEGVVVVAVKVGGAGVDFWAQDAGGGAQSGIYFFDRDGVTPADLAVGDEITVSGVYTEFYDLSEITVSSVEITNNGLTPSVDEVTLGDLAAAQEVWESCLVEISDADLTVASAANQYNEFPVTNGSDTFLVDDFLYDATADVGPGAAVSYLAGIVNYSFEEWKLLPRDAADILSETVPAVPATIEEVQTGLVAEGTDVIDVEDAVVVAIYESAGNTKRNFWIQQGTGVNSGILVYDNAGLLPTVAIGDTVNLRSVTYEEFKFSSWSGSMSELYLGSGSEVEVVSSGATPEVTSVSLADLLANAEGYESVLVELSDATLTVDDLNPDDPSDYGEYTITDGTNTLRVNDTMFDSRTGKTAAQSLTTVRGVVDYFIDFKLQPRDAADIQ